ncbi:Transcriptional regulator, TetR family [Burkholderia multivorans]
MSDKKESILIAATRLFACNGYHAVGVDRIIEESAVSKMTFYKYFPSKKDMMIAVLERRAEDSFASLANFVKPKRSATARIRAVFEWHTQWFKDSDFTGCMFIAATAEYHDLDVDIVAVATRQKRGLVGFIGQLATDVMPADQAHKFAERCVILLDGAIVNAQVLGNRHAADEAWSIARMLLQANGIDA